MLKATVAVVLLGVTLGAPNTKQPLPTLDGRIVGGRDADITDYPYQISVLYDTLDICGGALISLKWAVTAAHCVDYVEAKHIFIRTGTSLPDTGGEIIPSSNVILHPNYDDSNVDYDLALIELSSEVTIATASPAALPDADQPIPVGALATITGWGAVNASGNHPDVLQVVEVPVISQEDCRNVYQKLDVTDRMFCAGFLTTGGKDACQGDSGGPVIVEGVLTGLVSWGVGCAQPNSPGVYTNLRVLRSWIKEVTGL